MSWKVTSCRKKFEQRGFSDRTDRDTASDEMWVSFRSFKVVPNSIMHCKSMSQIQQSWYYLKCIWTHLGRVVCKLQPQQAAWKRSLSVTSPFFSGVEQLQRSLRGSCESWRRLGWEEWGAAASLRFYSGFLDSPEWVVPESMLFPVKAKYDMVWNFHTLWNVPRPSHTQTWAWKNGVLIEKIVR